MTRTLSALLALALVACDGGSTAPDSGPSDARAAVPVGGACGSTEECEPGAACIEHGDSFACMERCDTATMRLCLGGEVCSSAGSGGACLLGGDVAIGEPCSASAECEAGAICTGSACRQACTVGDDSPCASGETCLMLGATGADGYCAP